MTNFVSFKSIRPAAALAVGLLLLVWCTFPLAETNSLDRLIRLQAPTSFVTAVRSMAVMDQLDSPQRLREKTFVFPDVVLGDEDVFVYLEQTATSLGPRVVSTDQPGFRVVEVRFQDQKTPSRRELLKRTFAQSPLDTRIDRSVTPGLLRFTYRNPEFPLKVESVTYGYSDAEVRFEPLVTPGTKLGWATIRNGDGTLNWESLSRAGGNAVGAGSPVVRRYRLSRKSVDSEYSISVELTLAMKQWSHTIVTKEILLPVDVLLRDKLVDALALPDTGRGAAGQVSASASLIYIPFPMTDPVGKTPNGQQDAGLVIDAKRLEQSVFAGIIEDLKTRLSELESNEPGAEEFRKYVEFDADLLLLRELSRELKVSGDVRDGLVQTQNQLGGLVFQIPVDCEGQPCRLVFCPGRNISLLVPEAQTWVPVDARPLQFPAPNDRLVFAMTLKEANPLRVSEAQLDQIKQTVAASFNFPELTHSRVLLRTPPGQVLLSLPDDGSAASRISSLKVLPSAFGRDGYLRFGLSVSSLDANRLDALYLKQKGLPLEWNIGPIMQGELTPGRGAMVAGNPDNVLRSVVSVPDGFELISDPKREVDVTVMLDDELRTGSTDASVEVWIAYPDDPQRKQARRVSVDKEAGETTVRLPVRMSGGRLEPALYYSIDKGDSWILAEDGLYGLVFASTD